MFYSSSKTCNVCGYVNDGMKLSTRKWTCPEYDMEYDSDENASRNLYNVGVAHLTIGRVGTIRTRTCGVGTAGGTDVCQAYEAFSVEAENFNNK